MRIVSFLVRLALLLEISAFLRLCARKFLLSPHLFGASLHVV